MRRATLVFLLLILIPLTAQSGRVWTVDPGGSGDALTIQAGIDSASAGDTVIVVCGTYYEYGIVMKDSVYLASQSYSPTCVTIDAEEQGRVMLCDGLSSETWIVGFTLVGGLVSGAGEAGSGGGMACINSSSPFISSVYFEGNYASNLGGGLYCGNVSAPSLMFCHFRDNEAGVGGGGVAGKYYSPATIGRAVFQRNTTPGNGGAVYCEEMTHLYISRSTLVSNAAVGHGGGLYATVNSDPNLVMCIVAFGTDGEAAYADGAGSEISLSCCDLYGNAEGDWVGSIAPQEGVDGNFAADPLFCELSSDHPNIEGCSPCMAGYHPDGHDCGSYIGAYNVGCACGEATEPATWGAVKALYK